MGRRFYIDRLGVGTVAWGCLFTKTHIVVYWAGKKKLLQYSSMDEVPLQINDHLVWKDKK